MINKNTGASFLVVYVIYGSLVYTDNMQENCLVYSPTAGFIPFMQLLKGN